MGRPAHAVHGANGMLNVAGAGTSDVAFRAQQLLEQSLLGELRAVVARALSGLDLFSGQLSDLISGDVVGPSAAVPVRSQPSCRCQAMCWQCPHHGGL